MQAHIGITVQQRLMAGAAAIAMVGSANAAMAQTRSFDVPAGLASRTIPMLAKQAGVQILASGETIRSKRTNRVKGDYPVDVALRLLLEGTGLTAGTTNSGNIITIRSANQPARTEATEGGPGMVWEGPSGDEYVGKAEILVIGSRSNNADVRRTEDDAQPYVVFKKEEIAASQATTVEEFLRTRMTQNLGAGGASSQISGSGTPYSSFNLRGLGTNQTLILVNGRRLASLANQNFAPGQSDINGIPMGSIERIEILPASAGGIYGGNAVGGVINIILRSGYRGLEITATYNDTFDFHAPNGRLDVNGGLPLEGGRINITFGGSISRAGTLRLGDRRELADRGVDLYRRNIDIFASNATPPLGNGVNIRSATGAPLVLDNGIALGSRFTHVPLGYAGYASDDGALLRANAGTFNLDMPSDLQGARRGLLTPSEVESFNVNLRREFSKTFDVFIDYSRFVNRGVSYSVNQLPSSVTLSANAPNNPFQQNINVSFPNPGLSFPFKRSSETNRLTVGTIVRLPHKWAANIEYNKTWTTNKGVFYQAAIDDAGRACLNAGSASCLGGPALNPLQSPIDFGPFLFTEPTYLSGPYKSEFLNPSLRVSGPLFRLPGGTANLTLAVQRETSLIKTASNRVTQPSDRQYLYSIFPGRKQRTTSGYAEIVLPLVAPSNDIPFVNELELRGAVRHDRYFTSAPPAGSSFIDYDLGGGSLFTQLGGYEMIVSSDPDVSIPAFDNVTSRFKSTNFTLAGRWSPVEGVVFRASYATGFLPPSVVQISSQVTPGLMTFPDPFRGNATEFYPIDLIQSGSTILEPERSKSLSAGVILTPLPGFRLSADYLRLRKTDEIGAIPQQFLINNPDLFPGRVVRAPRDPLDPPGYLGRITSIDLTPVNLFRSLTQAVDFQVDYEFDTKSFGKFHLYALATWQPDSSRQLLVTAPAANFVGNADGPLKWQGNGGVNWTHGKLSIQWNTQFYNGYNVYPTQLDDTESSIAQTDLFVRQQGARRIPSQSYSDLYLSYDFKDARGILNGIRISGGVQNIFDKKPPVIATPSYSGAAYSRFGDPRLRRFTVSLRKSFGGKN